MGLFQNLTTSSPMVPIRNDDSVEDDSGRGSSSSSRSIHSTYSNSTAKGTSPNHPNTRSTPTPANANSSSNTNSIFPYAVGKYSSFHNDTEMDDPFAMSYDPSPSTSHAHSHRHRIDSQGVPIPPARTTSLGHHSHDSVSSSTTSLPSVQVITATPTKSRVSKYDQTPREQHVVHPPPHPHTHPYQGGYDASYSTSFGSGSLDVMDGGFIPHSENGLSFPPHPHYSSSTDQLTSYTSMEDDSDLDPEEQAKKEWKAQEAALTLEKTRAQNRDRQRRKRERDRAKAKKEKAAHHQPSGTVSMDQVSRNHSTSSLAPIVVPNNNLVVAGPSSASSVYSSLPNSASYLSLSPNTATSQQTSGTSSPTTFFSPMTPATAASASSGLDYPWSYANDRASKSAVDVRATYKSTGPSSINRNQAPQVGSNRAPPATATGTGSMQADMQMHTSKRRRSEPEPEHFNFKTKEVGLGVIGIAEQDTMELLSTPSEHASGGGNHLTIHGNSNMSGKGSGGGKARDRPGIRRTASDSAAVALDFTAQSRQQSRSVTPPLLDSLKTNYVPLALDQDMSGYSGADLLASLALGSIIDNPSEQVKRALAESKLTREGLLGMQGDLAIFFGRYMLEKGMSAVSLDDRPSTSYPTSTSAYASHSTTPFNDHVPLSATSTRPPSPMMPRFEMTSLASSIPPVMDSASNHASINTRASGSKATLKSSKVAPSRARSFSSASMRARGLTMSSVGTTSTSTKSPAFSLYHESLVSPLSPATYQFPNTPSTSTHIGGQPDSDGASASPMMSSVQTPTTGQGGFPHHEILAFGQQGGGEQRNRTMTEPGMSKVYTHSRHGTNWDIQPPPPLTQARNGEDQYHQGHRSSYSHSHSTTFAGTSELDSPLDFRRTQPSGQNQIIDPPPHLPPAFGFPQIQSQSQGQGQGQGQVGTTQSSSTSPVNTFQPTFQTPSTQRHHHQTHTSTSIPAGLSTPFTPTPHQGQSQSQYRPQSGGQGQGGIYQPIFTPIAEMSQMAMNTPHGQGQGETVFSPHSVPVHETGWMAFGQVIPPPAGFAGDPFQVPPQGHGHDHGHGHGHGPSA